MGHVESKPTGHGQAPASHVVKYDKGAPYYTTAKDGQHKLQFAEEGLASEAEIPNTTVVKIFQKAVAQHGKKTAMRAELPCPPLDPTTGKAPPPLPAKQWTSWTYDEYYAESKNAAKAYLAAGYEKYDSTAIYGFNSPFWFMAMMSSMLAGGKAAGIYPSDTAEQLQFKVDHSDAAVCVCDTLKQLAVFESVIDRTPYVKMIVVWGDEDLAGKTEIKRADGSSVKVVSWKALVAEGAALPDDDIDARIEGIKPADCCTLIYTSGTTGNPKAVMLSHDSMAFETICALRCMPSIGNEEERALSYLPLSHVAGMLIDIICPIVITAEKKGWGTISFARAYDLKTGSLKDRLVATKPTIFLGVPRVWEKFAEKMRAIGAKVKGPAKAIAQWAKRQGLRYQSEKNLGGSGYRPFFYGSANKIVLSKVKTAIGLNKCKFAFAGAAPMKRDILEYWGSLGINVNEVYGMSECAGATTWASDEVHLWGSVGSAMPGTEVKVFRVDDVDFNKKTECPRAKNVFQPTEEEQGEVCFRGRHIMMGYLANPRLGDEHVAEIEAKNAGAIDSEGWLHSGDKGSLDADGMLRITGRYKELIIGAGGENIAPVPVEDGIKMRAPALSNVVMIGDKKKYNVALITLVADGATGESKGTDDLVDAALEVDPAVTTISGAKQSKVWEEYIAKAIADTNADGSCVPSNAAKIQKWTILPHDLSVQGGELTATLKLKRSVVAKMYEADIDKLYADGAPRYVP